MKTATITRCGPRRFKLEYPSGEHATRFYRSRPLVLQAVRDHDYYHILGTNKKAIVRVVTWVGCKPPKEI